MRDLSSARCVPVMLERRAPPVTITPPAFSTCEEGFAPVLAGALAGRNVCHPKTQLSVASPATKIAVASIVCHNALIRTSGLICGPLSTSPTTSAARCSPYLVLLMAHEAREQPAPSRARTACLR
jgi:hypothetical protein